MNFSEAELMNTAGRSAGTVIEKNALDGRRCLSTAHSMRTIPCETSFFSTTESLFKGWKKLGQPLPDSKLRRGSEERFPLDHIHIETRLVVVPVFVAKARSVPFSQVTAYCSGVSFLFQFVLVHGGLLFGFGFGFRLFVRGIQAGGGGEQGGAGEQGGKDFMGRRRSMGNVSECGGYSNGAQLILRARPKLVSISAFRRSRSREFCHQRASVAPARRPARA